jgi:histidyl-tRNA synthetase
VLDTKDEDDLKAMREVPGEMPRMMERSKRTTARTSKRCAGLDALGIAHELDHGLVRGLDYYTRTASRCTTALARRARSGRRTL